MPPDGPKLPTQHELIYDEHWQTDVPHMLSFALVGNNENPNIVKDPDCLTKETLECRALQLYGPWGNVPKPADGYVYAASVEELLPEIAELPEFPRRMMVRAFAFYTTNIEMLMLCPKPHVYNSGSHRIMMMLQYNGERYVLAVEEGFGKQPLFIQALTPGGKVKLAENKEYAVEILEAGLRKAINAPLYRNNFEVHVYDDSRNLLQEGCAPSTFMNDH